MDQVTTQSDRLLDARETARVVGIKYNSLYTRVKLDDRFPKPVRMHGGRKRYWRHSDLQRYISSLEQEQ